MYSGAMYRSAAIKNAAKQRSKRFMRRELERPLAAAPEAAWLSSSATKQGGITLIPLSYVVGKCITVNKL